MVQLFDCRSFPCTRGREYDRKKPASSLFYVGPSQASGFPSIAFSSELPENRIKLSPLWEKRDFHMMSAASHEVTS